MSTNAKHAYIPAPPAVPSYDHAVALGWAYLSQIGAKNPIIVANRKPSLGVSPRLISLAKSVPVVRPKNANRVSTGYGHPVLAYAVDLRGLELAMRYADGEPVVLIEDRPNEWTGWARAVEARDLINKVNLSSSWTDEQRACLDSIDFNGNNGWFDNYGQRDMITELGRLRDLGDFDVMDVVTDQLARGHSYNSLEHLEKHARRVIGE